MDLTMNLANNFCVSSSQQQQQRTKVLLGKRCMESSQHTVWTKSMLLQEEQISDWYLRIWCVYHLLMCFLAPRVERTCDCDTTGSFLRALLREHTLKIIMIGTLFVTIVQYWMDCIIMQEWWCECVGIHLIRWKSREKTRMQFEILQARRRAKKRMNQMNLVVMEVSGGVRTFHAPTRTWCKTENWNK